MSKRIVVFNGSPRAGGNTNALINAFIAGANESGNIVERFDIAIMDSRSRAHRLSV